MKCIRCGGVGFDVETEVVIQPSATHVHDWRYGGSPRVALELESITITVKWAVCTNVACGARHRL